MVSSRGPRIQPRASVSPKPPPPHEQGQAVSAGLFLCCPTKRSAHSGDPARPVPQGGRDLHAARCSWARSPGGHGAGANGNQAAWTCRPPARARLTLEEAAPRPPTSLCTAPGGRPATSAGRMTPLPDATRHHMFLVSFPPREAAAAQSSSRWGASVPGCGVTMGWGSPTAAGLLLPPEAPPAPWLQRELTGTHCRGSGARPGGASCSAPRPAPSCPPPSPELPPSLGFPGPGSSLARGPRTPGAPAALGCSSHLHTGQQARCRVSPWLRGRGRPPGRPCCLGTGRPGPGQRLLPVGCRASEQPPQPEVCGEPPFDPRPREPVWGAGTWRQGLAGP